MPAPLKRREFIRSISLAGVSMALPGQLSGEMIHSAASNEISNQYLTLSFNRTNGTFSARHRDGLPLLTNGTARINLLTGEQLASADYRFQVRSARTNDALGPGQQLIVSAKHTGQQCDIELRLSLYDNLKAFTVEVNTKNVSGADLSIRSIEPVRVVSSDETGLHLKNVSGCITNGEMYFDDGVVHRFGDRSHGITSGDQKGVNLVNGPLPGQAETIHSWWNACVFSDYENEALGLGYLSNRTALGNVLISRPEPNTLSFIAESVFAPEVLLKPGAEISSGPVMATIGPSPYAAVEQYANAVGKSNAARVGSVVNGWCSWFYTLSQVTEQEVLANTKFAAEHLKSYGLEYIQIDEGYQRWHGDWEGNDRFPHGMKWLADQIKGYGFKAGIWISPYVISEPSPVFREHPEWLLKNDDGALQRVGNWPEGSTPPEDENPKRYCLDITHPGAAQWLHDLLDMIANQWGYEMIKIDFVAWSVLAAKQYYDRTVSSAAVYRKGMEIMRRAAGEKCHILECGPGNITAGLIDSMRIELDVNYGFAETAWNTYFVDQACSASAAGKRYYCHNRLWTNDVDHLCSHLLTPQQAEAAATIIAMSGGNTMSGDRLTQLDPYKLDVFRKVLPSYGAAAVPVDLLDADVNTAFAVKIRRPFGEWTVAAFFNPDLEEAKKHSYPISRLWLDQNKTYLVYDFWKQQYVGEFTGRLDLTIQPGAVTLLSLHEKTNHPKVISTDRHVMQGALELEDVSWDNNARVLSGVSLGPVGSTHNIYVYVPEEHPWSWGAAYVLFRDFDRYSLKLVHSNIIQVHVRFVETGRVEWKIDLDEFFR